MVLQQAVREPDVRWLAGRRTVAKCRVAVGKRALVLDVVGRKEVADVAEIAHQEALVVAVAVAVAAAVLGQQKEVRRRSVGLSW